MYEVRIPTIKLTKVLNPVYSRHLGIVCEWEFCPEVEYYSEFVEIIYSGTDYGDDPVGFRSSSKQVLELLVRIIYNK